MVEFVVYLVVLLCVDGEDLSKTHRDNAKLSAEDGR